LDITVHTRAYTDQYYTPIHKATIKRNPQLYVSYILFMTVAILTITNVTHVTYIASRAD